MMGTQPSALSLEAVAARSRNYFERLVDTDGLPFFNVFLTKPAEAAHDWPDFGDVMSRQLQAAVMLRHMTGMTVSTEMKWYEKILSYLDPGDGLLYRPSTTYSKHEADWGDASLTLYALITAYADNGSPDLRHAILKMVQSFEKRASRSSDWRGFILKSLMTTARVLNDETGLSLAAEIADKVMNEDKTFSPENTFLPGGHMHGNLRTLVGLADYALFTRDPELYSRVDAIYRYVRSTGTRFGFLPEVIGRQGDIIACETCALMDFAGLGVTLANHGHPEYWDDMERLARNHLVESQVVDPDWLGESTVREDTYQFSWCEIGQRTLGAYAGWSSPTHLLACEETLRWGGPELHAKARALQNCCGGSGVHGLFILWKNAARFEDNRLSVHMHLDKMLPQATIRCLQPFHGLLVIELRTACTVRVRIPDFTDATKIRVSANAKAVSFGSKGNYIELGYHNAGSKLEISYPLPLWTEEVVIGNPGWRQYRYKVTWKGDTVLKMEPIDNEQDTGYSEFDHKQVSVYYGRKGPHPIYKRAWMTSGDKTAATPLHMDESPLDFWYFGSHNT